MRRNGKSLENGEFCSKWPSNHGGWGCGADKGFLYTVALQKEIVQVLEHILAPEYQPGDSTGLRTPGGGAEPVYVLSTNAQQWCALRICCTTRLTSFPPPLGDGLKLSHSPLLACLTARNCPVPEDALCHRPLNPQRPLSRRIFEPFKQQKATRLSG